MPRRIMLLLLIFFVLFAVTNLSSASDSEHENQALPSQMRSGCAVDLMLVMDGSNSITTYDFFIMQEFARDLVNSFPVGPTDANVGVIQFADTAELRSALSDNIEVIYEGIGEVPRQMGGRTNIAAAIDLAQEQFVKRRAGIPRVIIVLTDGVHNLEGNPIVSADIARADGTAILGVAVGDFDLAEIIDIAGGDENVIVVSSFGGLEVILDILLNATCAVITVEQANEDGEIVEVSVPQAPTTNETQIVFASDRDGDMEIFTMNADGSNVQQLTFNNTEDNKPSWSKDGQYIAWESNVDGDFEIFVMNADGSNQRQATNDETNDWGPSWSPDSSQIAFHSDRDGDVELFVIDADGNNARQLTFNSGAVDRSPSWSPDGSRIVYYSDSSGGRELYILDLNTGGIQRLSTNEFYDGQPDWSLTGTQIVFGSAREDGNPEIFIMRIDGTNVERRTTSAGTDDDPVWSPDGRQIVFESDRNGNFDIWVMNADGTGLVQLTTESSTDWSPDWIWKPQ